MAALTAAWVETLSGPRTIVAGSRDARLVPSAVRVAAMRCSVGSDRVTIWVATESSQSFLADVRSTGTIAVSVLEPISHRTLQLKGHATDVRDATADEQPFVERQLGAYFELLEHVGLPRRLTGRYVWWPATAIDIVVAEVFDQSPGPGAGERAQPR